VIAFSHPVAWLIVGLSPGVRAGNGDNSTINSRKWVEDDQECARTGRV